MTTEKPKTECNVENASTTDTQQHHPTVLIASQSSATVSVVNQSQNTEQHTQHIQTATQELRSQRVLLE